MKKDSLWMSATQMDGQPAIDQAKKAIRHTLVTIMELPEAGYHLGPGTQTFSLLTEAAATLWSTRVDEVRRNFRPKTDYDRYPAATPLLSEIQSALRDYHIMTDRGGSLHSCARSTELIAQLDRILKTPRNP